LFHIFIFIYKKYFASGKKSFVMCKKKLYQSPLSLSRKNKLYKMIQFTFSITLDFVIPNSSNHCTCQRIFIMYSYICIMFYFCMHDGGGDRDSSLTAARWQQQLGGGSCDSLTVAAWWQQLGGGSGSAAAVAAAAVAALQ
jgi:hypothetical protein